MYGVCMYGVRMNDACICMYVWRVRMYGACVCMACVYVWRMRGLVHMYEWHVCMNDARMVCVSCAGVV